MIVFAELVGFMLQLGLFLAIPFVWHRASSGSFSGFWAWLGLRVPDRRGVLWAAGSLVALQAIGAFVVPHVAGLRTLMLSPGTPTARLREMGLSAEAVVVLVIVAVLKTGLCEELFFRGFVAKRLVARLGLWPGNVTQAALFAAVHLPLLLLVPPEVRTPSLVAFIVLNALVVSVVATWLNEARSSGSIVPGWILHGGGNLISYAAVAFG